MKKNIQFFAVLAITVLILTCFFSCDKTSEIKPAVYQFEISNSVDIVLEQNDRNFSMLYEQFVEIDGKSVMILKVPYNKLSFYDVRKGDKIHEIILDSTRVISNYKFINKDSIIVVYDIHNKSEELKNPSMFQIVNYNGDVIETFDYSIDKEFVSQFNYKLSDIFPIIPYIGMPMCNDKIFFQPYHISSWILGTKENIDNPIPFALMFDLEKQKYVISKHKSFPYVKEGMYYPTSRNLISISVSSNNMPLYRYFYSSNVFEWDFNNDEIITHSFKSALIDTIMPIKEQTRYAENTIDAFYCNCYYDKCNSLYYSEISFNENFYGTYDHGILIADKDFNYLGEIYNNSHWPAFSNEDLLWELFVKNDSVITINYLEIVKTNRNYDNYIDSCRNDLEQKKKAVEDYTKSLNSGKSHIVEFLKLEKKDLNTDDIKIITFYTNNGCPSCSEAIYNEIKNNREHFENGKLYIIISANSRSEAIAELSRYGLQDFKYLTIDATNSLKSLAGTRGLLNPRITVVKDEKVVLDTIYSAKDIKSKFIPNMYKEHNLNLDEGMPVFSGEQQVEIVL